MKKLRLRKVAIPSNFSIVLIGIGVITPYFIFKELEIEGK